MDEFTASNALLTGVRLVRRRPWLVALWAAVLLAQTLVFAAAAQTFMAAVRANLSSGRPVASQNVELLAFTLARAAVSLVFATLLWSSAFRAILRPALRRPLGFGPEELAVLGVWVITQGIVVIVSTPLPLLLVGRVAVNPKLILDASAAVTVLGLFWSAVASVWAFDRRQVAPFRCWTIARGRFWLMAGLVVGVAVLDRLANVGIRQLAAALGYLLPPSNVVQADPTVVDLFRVPALLQEVLSAGIGALEIAFVAGVVACAYRAGAPEPQAAAFSSAAGGPAS
jgi:hypothetical protein